MIGPGSSNAWYVTVTRTNGFAGAVKIEMKGLPKGVTVNPLTIPATMTVGTLVLTAVSEATLDVSNVEIVGTSVATIDGKEVPLTRTAIGMDEIYFPGGGRGVFAVEMKTVAITEVSDVMEVIVEPSNLVLKAGQEVKLDVTIKRSANFKEAVNLDIILRHLGGIFANPLPTGVTMVDGKSKTLIPANATKGHITLKVAPDAPLVENVPICVMANVSINFVVKVSHTSKPLMLTIQK